MFGASGLYNSRDRARHIQDGNEENLSMSRLSERNLGPDRPQGPDPESTILDALVAAGSVRVDAVRALPQLLERDGHRSAAEAALLFNAVLGKGEACETALVALSSCVARKQLSPLAEAIVTALPPYLDFVHEERTTGGELLRLSLHLRSEVAVTLLTHPDADARYQMFSRLWEGASSGEQRLLLVAAIDPCRDPVCFAHVLQKSGELGDSGATAVPFVLDQVLRGSVEPHEVGALLWRHDPGKKILSVTLLNALSGASENRFQRIISSTGITPGEVSIECAEGLLSALRDRLPLYAGEELKSLSARAHWLTRSLTTDFDARLRVYSELGGKLLSVSLELSNRLTPFVAAVVPELTRLFMRDLAESKATPYHERVFSRLFAAALRDPLNKLLLPLQEYLRDEPQLVPAAIRAVRERLTVLPKLSGLDPRVGRMEMTGALSTLETIPSENWGRMKSVVLDDLIDLAVNSEAPHIPRKKAIDLLLRPENCTMEIEAALRAYFGQPLTTRSDKMLALGIKKEHPEILE